MHLQYLNSGGVYPNRRLKYTTGKEIWKRLDVKMYLDAVKLFFEAMDRADITNVTAAMTLLEKRRHPGKGASPSVPILMVSLTSSACQKSPGRSPH